MNMSVGVSEGMSRKADRMRQFDIFVIFSSILKYWYVEFRIPLLLGYAKSQKPKTGRKKL